LATSNNIADIYLLSGRFKDAASLQVETLRQAQDAFGDQHSTTAILMLTHAEIYESLYRKSDALKLLDIAEHAFAVKFGTSHPLR
jgi:Tetratricopeptide repeat